MNTISVKVKGEFACFTHPALKTERATYPVITPSACDGILRNIFWKPEFKYEIVRIDVLNEIKTLNIMRNELKFDNKNQVLLSAERTQRISETIIDPAYVIHARQIMVRNNNEANRIKMQEMFNRRVRKGQCFYQPFFGIKEFICHFEEYNPEIDVPISATQDLGVMFHYYLYPENGYEMEPRFFHAKMINGSIEVPPLGERYVIG